jgi:kynurenine formamidase
MTMPDQAQYHSGFPFLTAAAARYLADAGAVLVGIDAPNVDDTGDPERPAHAILLAAGVGICEHLTGLAALPGSGFKFPPCRRRWRPSAPSRSGLTPPGPPLLSVRFLR